jgi:hypothetical protein
MAVDNVVSEEVRRLIQAGVSSMDHVDLLFHLRARESSASELAATTRFDHRLIGLLLADLEGMGLATQDNGRFALTADRRDRAALDDLLTIYNSRPVTLVRAIYRANV